MDILSPVIDRLKTATEAEVHAMACASGVPASTIMKLKYGQTPNPRIRTVQKLYSHLIEQQLA